MNIEQALWISIIMTPCLSVSLATAFYDDDIMTKAKGKDWLCSINWTVSIYSKFMIFMSLFLSLFISNLLRCVNYYDDF